ncbi:hypothetical protein OG921_24505 [Aldersonia sp. NBC_00410]|uniref:hypothetical protein n=1 Tax=Aldersonia sp. NBC_00410 TaxID=2975954 RepID=UPI00225B6C94|nr:hypothetical protein [Aldersonia sp. NBC_00410]MCX5046339.1 hypothetical protein [Aldersonia sp. NBC_00410]
MRRAFFSVLCAAAVAGGTAAGAAAAAPLDADPHFQPVAGTQLVDQVRHDPRCIGDLRLDKEIRKWLRSIPTGSAAGWWDRMCDRDWD